MCIHVDVADDLPDMVVWVPDEVTVLISRGAPLPEVIKELHALLTIDLGAPGGTGAAPLCFCGTVVRLPVDLLTPVVEAMAC
ncbi:hypothetical protein KBY47_34535 [Streptomyces sp. B93]|nr:hypothetical protein [Streptomyces sp. B93]